VLMLGPIKAVLRYQGSFGADVTGTRKGGQILRIGSFYSCCIIVNGLLNVSIELNTVYCTTQSVNNATNCSNFLTLSLSTQLVWALIGHLQVSYYAKTATLH
jgi:hypothetical protein